MRVFVSGAAGFLGSAFMKFHRERGDEVLGVDIVRAEGVFHADAMEVFGSGTKHYDRAYHFAGVVGGRTVIEDHPLAQAGNLGLDGAFFRWASHSAEVAIYPSSSAVYGIGYQHGEGQPLSEDLFHPEQMTWAAPDNLYGLEKLVGEYLAWRASHEHGLSTLCIRPFSGYGPGQSLDYPVPAICQRAVKQENPLVVWGSGTQSRDFVYIDDVVDATDKRLLAGVRGYTAMNIGTGIATTFRQIAEMAAHLAGYHPRITTDESKPQGVHARYADPALLRAYHVPAIGLDVGLQRVMESLLTKAA